MRTPKREMEIEELLLKMAEFEIDYNPYEFYDNFEDFVVTEDFFFHSRNALERYPETIYFHYQEYLDEEEGVDSPIVQEMNARGQWIQERIKDLFIAKI